jgi:hypothetical protein
MGFGDQFLAKSYVYQSTTSQCDLNDRFASLGCHLAKPEFLPPTVDLRLPHLNLKCNRILVCSISGVRITALMHMARVRSEKDVQLPFELMCSLQL